MDCRLGGILLGFIQTLDITTSTESFSTSSSEDNDLDIRYLEEDIVSYRYSGVGILVPFSDFGLENADHFEVKGIEGFRFV